jgi:hypothetical protein
MNKTLVKEIGKIDLDLYRATSKKEPIESIVAGTTVTVNFNREDASRMTIEGQGINIKTLAPCTVSIVCKSARWNYYFKGKKIPTEKTLENWYSEGVCKSLAGKRVEPDGWDDVGTPSWLLVLGMI